MRWLLLLLLAQPAPAGADEARRLLENTLRKFPPPAAEKFGVEELQAAGNSALILSEVARRFPGDAAGREADRISRRLVARGEELKAELLASLAPLEAATRAALAPAIREARALRGEIRAKAKLGEAPPARTGGCVALDYGGDEPLFGIVVVKIGKTAPGEAWGRLVYRARRGDDSAETDDWSRILRDARAHQVPAEALAGGIAVDCARGTGLVKGFAKGRQAGHAEWPVRRRIRLAEQLLLLKK